MDAQKWSIKTFTDIIAYVQSAFKKQNPPAASLKNCQYKSITLTYDPSMGSFGTTQTRFTSSIYFHIKFEPAFQEINFKTQKRCL